MIRDQVLSSLQDAKKQLHVAKHFIEDTMKVVDDPALFLSVLAKLDKANEISMSSLLTYELEYKRIRAFNHSFEGRMLKMTEIHETYDISRDVLEQVLAIHRLCEQHQKSMMDIRKNKDELILVQDDYSLDRLRAPQIKKYINASILLFTRVRDYILAH